MPIYEYICLECESRFDELVQGSDAEVACPECGSRRVKRLFSTFIAGRRTGSTLL